VIPLRDNVPTRTLPIIAVGLIFVNVLIFLWQRFALPDNASEMVYKYYGFVPREFMTSLITRWDLLPYNALTLFSSMFLHGSFLHLAGNMLYFWIFGNNIEDAFGHMRFIPFYISSGLVAAVVQFFYDPTSGVPMIGASGAISGILGAYLVLFPYARIKTLVFFFVVDLPAVVLLTIWFFVQIYYSTAMEGIAWYAHIGGFIFGLLTAKLFVRKQGRKSRPFRTTS